MTIPRFREHAHYNPDETSLPADEVIVIVALHVVLNGGLQVPNPLEGQLEVSL